MRRKAKAPKVNPTAYLAVLVLAPILSCVSFHSLTQTKENNIGVAAGAIFLLKLEILAKLLNVNF